MNKKVGKKFTECLKNHNEKKHSMYIRKTVKVFEIDKNAEGRTLKALGKVNTVRALRLVRSKTSKLKRKKSEYRCLY